MRGKIVKIFATVFCVLVACFANVAVYGMVGYNLSDHPYRAGGFMITGLLMTAGLLTRAAKASR